MTLVHMGRPVFVWDTGRPKLEMATRGLPARAVVAWRTIAVPRAD